MYIDPAIKIKYAVRASTAHEREKRTESKISGLYNLVYLKK